MAQPGNWRGTASKASNKNFGAFGCFFRDGATSRKGWNHFQGSATACGKAWNRFQGITQAAPRRGTVSKASRRPAQGVETASKGHFRPEEAKKVLPRGGDGRRRSKNRFHGTSPADGGRQTPSKRMRSEIILLTYKIKCYGNNS